MKNILITGASSGLGAALAEAYAGPNVRLFLCGRDEVRLGLVADRASHRGAEAHIQPIDVTEAGEMAAWIVEIDARYSLDLVIANAGISAGTGKKGMGSETPAQNAAIFATNVQGVFNTIHPIIPRMKERRSGQIAIMSSLAGFRGIAGAPSYAGSKAAVRVYGEALRGELAPFGVKVNVICPGFVKTPLTDVNEFPMPFVMDAGRAARIMKRGLDCNHARIAFPWRMAALVWLIAALPPALTDPLLSRLRGKA